MKGVRLWYEKCVALMITGLTKGKCLWDDSKTLLKTVLKIEGFRRKVSVYGMKGVNYIDKKGTFILSYRKPFQRRCWQ